MSNSTIRFDAPKPVKKALPWLERFDPSIRNTPRLRKPQRCSSPRTRSASSPSVSGVNLLNQGITTVGMTSCRTSRNTFSVSQTYSHQNSPIRCISQRIAISRGTPISAASSICLARSVR